MSDPFEQRLRDIVNEHVGPVDLQDLDSLVSEIQSLYDARFEESLQESEINHGPGIGDKKWNMGFNRRTKMARDSWYKRAD